MYFYYVDKVYIGIVIEFWNNFKDTLWETKFTHEFLAKNEKNRPDM